MKFINRKQELKFLERKFKSGRAELIILYGRRRIGKTELILKSCTNKKFAYFIGRLESKEDTLKRFNNLLIETFNDKKLLNYPLPNWDAVFDYIAEKTEKRIIFVFDEFPFIVEKFPEIISVFQDKWDSKLKDSNLMVILSGSSVSMMEKYALDYKSPLYGRRTGQWKVDKMGIDYLREFLPCYNIEDLIRVYSCLDTIPGYLTIFSCDKLFFENIKDKVLSKGEFLYEEIEILLREELRDPSNYMSIISSIAGGLTTFNDIYNRTGLDKSLLSKYLHILGNLGVIEKIIPVTEGYKAKLKAKGALYYLKDNFFDFWFRFVYLNKQELEKGNSESVLKNIKPEIERYVSRKFEGFSAEFLPFTDIIDITRIGRWWHKDKEIDIVALNEKTKEILFAECKWQDKVNAEKILEELKEKSKYVQWNNEKRKEHFAIFAKSFKNKKIKGVQLFDLRDIEKLLKKKK
ncbi:archaeal ATPase [archaeon BMS3Abin17]|nr:archaeal ATPase [archaeon BMS3Abin17]HDZ60830.1 ATP-binding protein [Candidatus Pacearchaeota archaeon]